MASYAAAIRDALGIDPEIETGARGQFDVLVNGSTVISRQGGLLALLLRKPWPDSDAVVDAVRSAIQG